MQHDSMHVSFNNEKDISRLTIKYLGIDYHDALNNTEMAKRGFINK